MTHKLARVSLPFVRAGAAALLVVACVAPSALLARHAYADNGDDEADTAQQGEKMSADDLPKKRRATLESMVKSDAALINVTSREMPASPDILNLGRKGTMALARCVSDNVHDSLRAMCASMLGRIGDKAALPALQGALEAWDASVRGAAITALRRMPDRSSVEPLRKLVAREDEEEDNRARALEALGAMSDTRSLGVLRQRLRKEDAGEQERTAAFRGLWKSRHLMDRGTLDGDVDYALSSKKSALVVAATFAASELQSPQLAPALIALMRSPDARIRNRAVYALGKIGDRSSSKALIAQIPQVRESRMLNNIAFALERLDPGAFYQTAQRLVSHSQAQIRMNAAYVVGDVRRPEGLPLLRAALDDKNDSVRLSAITAIGKLDAPDGAKLLDKYVDDPNASLRSAAVYAIYALSGMKRTDLVYDTYYASPRPAEKLTAVRALGRGRDPRVTGDLLACIDLDRGCQPADYDAAFRLGRSPEVPGRLLLAWAHGHEELTDLVTFLHPEGARTIALAQMGSGLSHKDVEMTANAIDLSGSMTDAQAVEVLKPLLTHENSRLRLHAAVALARAGFAGALPVLVQELQNLPHEQLPPAVRLLSTVSQPDVIQRLTPALQTLASGADVPLAVAARATLVEWSPEAGVFALLQTLRGPTRQERDLSELYLVQSKKPVVTELLRRALAREGDTFVRNQLRRILDRRNERETHFSAPE